MGFSILDWLTLLVVVLNVAGAIAEGFVYEVFSFAGVIAGYLLAAWEYPRVAAFYSHYVSSAWAADVAGFLTVFFVVLLLGGVAGKIGRSLVEGIGLRWIDRFLGGLFGFLKGVVVCTVIVMALAAFTPTSSWVRDSRIAPFMLVTGRALIWAAPSELRQRFTDGWNLLRTVPEHISHASGGNSNGLTETLPLSGSHKERRCERPTGSPDSANA